MPLYEFACPACGAIFEEICSATAETAQCPACGAGAKRRIGLPAPLRSGAFPYPPTGEVRRMPASGRNSCGGSCGRG